MKTQKRHYMYFNVILTFDTLNKHCESQEFFEMKLSLKINEGDSYTFLMNKFFPKIIEKCTRLNRNVCDLAKISTASDWNLFEKVTGLDALCTLGHPCKWYFGVDRDDLDEWETTLMNKYGFGTNRNPDLMQAVIKCICCK